MTYLHKLPTEDDKSKLFWIVQACNHYKNSVENLSHDFAYEFAEAIVDSYFPDWNPEDAVDEDLSYWR